MRFCPDPPRPALPIAPTLEGGSPRRVGVVAVLALALLWTPKGVPAQEAPDPARQGPYDRLVVQGAMVIPGHGGPAYGPADIVIEDDVIVRIVSYNGVTGRPQDADPTHGRGPADRVIDARGMYVMPGLIDLHAHIRSEPLPLQYIYDLKLAHGVTTMVNGSGRGWAAALEQQRLAEEGRITAPRMYPIRDWGPPRSRDPGHAPAAEEMVRWHDPSRAPRLADSLVAAGAHVVRVGSLAWNAELFGEVVDRLVASGVSLIPTMSTYEANRDINRAMGLPWHEAFTHPQLIDWYFANPENHAAHHWDWTSGDEDRWAETFRKWQRLIHEFHDRGGHLSYAVDDPYLWNTTGIANVRELQLVHEAGLDPLENLRYLYAFGALDMTAEGRIVRRGGVRWTVKGGQVFDNELLVERVVEMVREAKEGWTSPVDSLFTPVGGPGDMDHRNGTEGTARGASETAGGSGPGSRR